MDPTNDDTSSMYTPSVPYLHIVKGGIPSDGPVPTYPFTPGMFDTIIVDFSTLKFMADDKLAEFAALYLKQKTEYDNLDGIFVRDLASSEYEYTPVHIGNYVASGRLVEIVVDPNMSIHIYLQRGWSTEHYFTLIGISGRNVGARYKGHDIEANASWIEVVPPTDRNPKIILVYRLGLKSMHQLIESFLRHNLTCVPVQDYPLRSRFGGDLDEKVRCRILPSSPTDIS